MLHIYPYLCEKQANIDTFVGDLQELARNEMIEMMKRILLEADLEDEISKLGVFGKTIEGIKEFLAFLLKDPQTGWIFFSLFLLFKIQFRILYVPLQYI